MSELELIYEPGQKIQQASINGLVFNCHIGKNGISHFHIEGDGITPTGKFKPTALFYRPDKINQDEIAEINLPKFAISQNLIWCDDPKHILYNKPLINHEFSASHEKMWRDDGAYDLVISTTHNHMPTKPYLGSAIFLHLQKPSSNETEGCLAFEKKDFLEIAKNLSIISIKKTITKH